MPRRFRGIRLPWSCTSDFSHFANAQSDFPIGVRSTLRREQHQERPPLRIGIWSSTSNLPALLPAGNDPAQAQPRRQFTPRPARTTNTAIELNCYCR